MERACRRVVGWEQSRALDAALTKGRANRLLTCKLCCAVLLHMKHMLCKRSLDTSAHVKNQSKSQVMLPERNAYMYTCSTQPLAAFAQCGMREAEQQHTS